MKRLEMIAKLKEIRLLVCVYEMIMTPIHSFTNRWKQLKKKIRGKLTKTRFSYGSLNQDKVIYVITSDADQCGIFSLILINILPCLAVSEREGFVPIVDYKNTKYLSMIQDEEDYGKENPWEYYFEQPGEVDTLEETYSSAKVEKYNRYKCGFQTVQWNEKMPMPMDELKIWSRIANKYIRPSEEVLKRIDAEKERLFFANEKILGVSIRAGYRRSAILKYDIIKNHPKVATCEYYIETIQKKMKEWGYDKFFLACEDREYVTKIEKHFGNKCIHINRRYAHMFHDDVPIEDLEELLCEYEGVGTRERNIEYITETYLLSECDSLYSTINGGAQFAYIINGGKYKRLEIYNEGLYC